MAGIATCAGATRKPKLHGLDFPECSNGLPGGPPRQRTPSSRAEAIETYLYS